MTLEHSLQLPRLDIFWRLFPSIIFQFNSKMNLNFELVLYICLGHYEKIWNITILNQKIWIINNVLPINWVDYKCLFINDKPSWSLAIENNFDNQLIDTKFVSHFLKTTSNWRSMKLLHMWQIYCHLRENFQSKS